MLVCQVYHNKKRKGFTLIEVTISVFIILILFIPTIKTISSSRIYKNYLRDYYIVDRICVVAIDDITNKLRYNIEFYNDIVDKINNSQNGYYEEEKTGKDYGSEDVKIKIKYYYASNSDCIIVYVNAYYMPYPQDQYYKLQSTYSIMVSKRW